MPTQYDSDIVITTILSIETFDAIKDFVLKNGDTKTYRNFDNNNPHFSFPTCNVYFGSDIGQQNINNDPTLSDFNELTIVSTGFPILYYKIVAVKTNAFNDKKANVRPGMKEQDVYLIKGSSIENMNTETLKTSITTYLTAIRETMAAE